MVWHSGLTEELTSDLERVQKCAVKVILQNSYTNYNSALQKLQLSTLKQRREALSLDFARKSVNHTKMKHLFIPNNKTHTMVTRMEEKYQVMNAHTQRLQSSPIFYMQKLLNNYAESERN